MAVSKAKLKEWQDLQERAEAKVERVAKQRGLTTKDILDIYDVPKNTLKGITRLSDKVVDERIENLTRLATVQLVKLDSSEGNYKENFMPRDEIQRISNLVTEENKIANVKAKVDKLFDKSYVYKDPFTGKLDLRKRDKYDPFIDKDDFRQKQYQDGKLKIGKIYNKKENTTEGNIKIEQVTPQNLVRKATQGTMSKQRMKTKYFKMLRDNLTKKFDVRIGNYTKNDIKRLLNKYKVTDVELYYMFRYSEVFSFDFIYNDEDFANKKELIKTEIERIRNDEDIADAMKKATKMLSHYIDE